jgi:PAS domain S-box-containing protein
MSVPAPHSELAQFFDLSHDLFCVVGFDGRCKLVNGSFERVLGYSREELMARPVMDLVHPEDVERARSVFAVPGTGEEVIGFESRLVCADGGVRRFEWNTRTVPHLEVVYGIARDVTERAALTEQQSALRRVATLVARQSPPDDVLSAVAAEMARLLGVATTSLWRFEDDETVTLVARWGDFHARAPVGRRFALTGDSVTGRVSRTGRPVRIDDYTGAAGEIVEAFKGLGVRSGVGAPIMVDGRLWGSIGAAATEPLPPDAESRIAEFTDLVALAIANVEARTELTASRARIMAAAHQERRRVVRDLHDGAQQRLVHAGITLKLAREALEADDEDAPSLVREALAHAERANHELRELAHGIMPAALTTGGLRAGVGELASRMPMPVQVEVCEDRLPAPIEATVYFVVAEALTNVAKHAHASTAAVSARLDDGKLRIEVRDDGVGGVRPEGSGLQGLGDRVAAIDGRLRIHSPAGGGTVVEAAIPIAGGPAPRGNGDGVVRRRRRPGGAAPYAGPAGR